MEDNKIIKKRKIGRLTFGFVLILLGISVFIQSLLPNDILKYVLMMWPLVFIMLGIEIIYFSKKNDVEVKYDVAGIILTLFILVSASIFSVINYGVNKIIYNSDIKQEMFEAAKENEVLYTFKGNANIVNISNKEATLNIIENANAIDTRVSIKMIFNENTKISFIPLIRGNYNTHRYTDFTRDSNNNNAQIVLNSIPKWCEQFEISVVTPSKNNITTEGLFNPL